MISRSQNSNQPNWIGPQKVIIQNGNHTVWTTTAGKLFRSAPENVRLALPAEGMPCGPELPEDTTMLQNQVNRMNQQSVPVDSPNLVDNPNNLDEPIIPDNHPEGNDGMTPADEEETQSLRTFPQPDQEPEANCKKKKFPSENSSSEEEAFLICTEEPGALTCDISQDLAWICDFDIPIPNTYAASDLSTVEAWTLLASTARKQRSVRLGELTKREQAEFEIAKQAEVDNWIKTGTSSKVLRDQIPHDQILRCRWILTWKPVDSTEVTTSANHPKGRSHRAKAR